MGYIGTSPVPRASMVLTEGKLASATNIIPVPGGFSPNNIFVYINGSRLAQGDYDDSDGSAVDVSLSMPDGEVLPVETEYVIEEARTFESANHYSKPESDIRYTRNSTLDVDLSSGSATLSESESAYEVIQVTGGLTSDSTLIVPDTARKYTIVNGTSGSFTVTVKTAAGAGVVVSQGQARVLRSDGVDVVDDIEVNAEQVLYDGPADATNTKEAIDAINSDTGFTIIYPNGGTEAIPANVTNNSRYIETNPFPGFFVQCEAEIRVNGEWGASPVAGITTSGGTQVYRGVSALQLSGDEIVVQTLESKVYASSAVTGNPFGTTADATTAPCRVKVWKVKGSTV